MQLKNMDVKIRKVKKLINLIERKSIEIITASAELEYKYKKAVNSNELTYQTTTELLLLEKKIDDLLDNSPLTYK